MLFEKKETEMGAPNQQLSRTANFIINGDPEVTGMDDDDFIEIVNAAIEVLRGMKRRATLPKISDQLNNWLRRFIERGDTLPPDLMRTRGMLIWLQFGGIEPYYFLADDLKLYAVYRDWHDGSGVRTDDSADWKYHTPVLRKLTVEEFGEVMKNHTRVLQLSVIGRLINGLRELEKDILSGAAYVGKRAEKLEAMMSRAEQAEGL